MNYWLHPEANEDLREAAKHYRERAGNSLLRILAVAHHSRRPDYWRGRSPKR